MRLNKMKAIQMSGTILGKETLFSRRLCAPPTWIVASEYLRISLKMWLRETHPLVAGKPHLTRAARVGVVCSQLWYALTTTITSGSSLLWLAILSYWALLGWSWTTPDDMQQYLKLGANLYRKIARSFAVGSLGLVSASAMFWCRQSWCSLQVCAAHKSLRPQIAPVQTGSSLVNHALLLLGQRDIPQAG